MEFLDDAPEGEIVDSPVKPGAIRIILADSQAIYRVGIRKVSRSKTISASLPRPTPSKICAPPSNAIPLTLFCLKAACSPVPPT